MKKIKQKAGYILIYSPNHPFNYKGYVPEHRLVVEFHLNRYLTKGETVHHLNEIKTDNRIENLMLFKSNSEHMKWHTKLKRYGYLTKPMLRDIENRWN